MKLKLAVLISLAAAALPAAAQTKSDHESHHAAPATTADRGALAEGEVRRVDKDAKKITIKHGPLAKLDMPPMTMVFQVKEPAMLESVKAGDKVMFDAEKINGRLVVTEIRPAK